MGYVSYEDVKSVPTSTTTGSQVGFFSLKNDKEEAIVRFMHDSTADFEVIATHQISLNGKFRRVSCTRSPKEPLHKCPLCEKGEKVDYRFYIHLLQYTRNADGSITVEPKVWERSTAYADKMSGYISNYGPMSDVICKIIRNGKPGDMKTEYDIIPNLNKQVYRDDLFVKVHNAFSDWKALGRVVLDKTEDEIREYIATGNFPMRDSKVQETTQVSNSTAQTSANPVDAPMPNLNQEDEVIEWTRTTGDPLLQNHRNFNYTTNQASPVARPTRF